MPVHPVHFFSHFSHRLVCGGESLSVAPDCYLVSIVHQVENNNRVMPLLSRWRSEWILFTASIVGDQPLPCPRSGVASRVSAPSPFPRSRIMTPQNDCIFTPCGVLAAASWNSISRQLVSSTSPSTVVPQRDGHGADRDVSSM